MTYVFDECLYLNQESVENLEKNKEDNIDVEIKKNSKLIELIELVELGELDEIIKNKKKVDFFHFVDVVQIPNKDSLDKSIWYTRYEFALFRQHFIRDIQNLIQNNIAANYNEAKNKLCDPNFEENPIDIIFELNKILRDKNLVDSSCRIFCEDDY